MERFNVKKLKEEHVKERCHVTIRKEFEDLKKLRENGDINKSWKNISEDIKISAQECLDYCESKYRKQWFDNECSQLVDRRKHVQLQWLQDPSNANEDNLSDVRREANRHFRNKERECLKDKINDLESNSKNRNIRDLYRGINEFKTCYQPRTNLVKNERGYLLADPHKILSRWKNYFCQLLNVHGPGGVRQTEMNTTETFDQRPVPQNLRLLLET
jgi:hypothetical protein